MNEFEKEYYEDERLWSGEMLNDSSNRERINVTSDLIPADVTSLLDVGCGNGVFLNYLHQKRQDIISLTGVDRSVTALKYVKTNKVVGDINNLEFEDNSFDCVCALEVIEHLPVKDYIRSLSELARVAKKYIIISVPYAEPLEDNFTKCPSCKALFNRDLHMRNYSDETFKSLFDKLGYRNIVVKKIGKVDVYVGHRLYRRLFFRNQILQMNFSICPVCGFKADAVSGTGTQGPVKPRGLISALVSIPKAFWPKTHYYYWIVGVFEKRS